MFIHKQVVCLHQQAYPASRRTARLGWACFIIDWASAEVKLVWTMPNVNIFGEAKNEKMKEKLRYAEMKEWKNERMKSGQFVFKKK